MKKRQRSRLQYDCTSPTLIFTMKNWIKLVIALVICQLAGIIGSIFTSPNIGAWYATLIGPSFAPPNWIFGPVWITLFVLMGISLYLVWKEKKNKIAISLFFIQLGLNVLWSFFFFGLQNPLLALIELVILWVFILLTILYFFKISKLSGYLMLPYIIWVSFAFVLNLGFVILN